MKFSLLSSGLILSVFLSAYGSEAVRKEIMIEAENKESKKLFNQHQSDEDIAKRSDFLNEKSLYHPMGNPGRLSNVPEYMFNHNVCPSPRMGTYHEPASVTEAYCLKIPSEFSNNIPVAIKDEIMKHDIESLDIYFIAQSKNAVNGKEQKVNALKAHYWAYPIPIFWFTGEIFNRNMLMTFYNYNENIKFNTERDVEDEEKDEEKKINKYLEENNLSSFTVSIHDYLLSPETSYLSISGASNHNFSFYSLIINEQDKKAVVTLHWLMEQDDFLNDEKLNHNHANSLEALNASFQADTSISDLLDRLDESPLFNSNENPFDNPLNQLFNLFAASPLKMNTDE